MVPQEAELGEIEEQNVVEPVADQPTEQTIQVVKSVEERDKNMSVGSDRRE